MKKHLLLITVINLILTAITLISIIHITTINQTANPDDVVSAWLMENYGVSSIDELVQQKLKEYGVQYTGNPFTTALYPGQLQAENITGMHWYTYRGGSLFNRTDVIANPEQPASYIIFGEDNNNDGVYDIIYAKNASSGQIEFSGTDAATVIQNAINQLTNGGKIFIKAGTYECSQSIFLKDNVIIEGEGTKTILKAISLSEDFIRIYDVENVTVSNIKIMHVGGSGYLLLIYVNTRNIIVENCHFNGEGVGAGIGVMNINNKNIWIKNNYLINFTYEAIAIGKNASNVIISGNVISNCGRNGIWILGATGYTLSDIIISSNIVTKSQRSLGGGCIEVLRSDGSTIKRILIENNILLSDGQEVATGCGIHVTGGGTTGEITDVQILGNIVAGDFPANGICVEGADGTYLNHDVLIANNLIDSPENIGIDVIYTTKASIISNYIKNCGNKGIYIAVTSMGLVSDNVILNSGTAIYIATPNTVTIKNNVGFVTENSGSVEFSGTSVSFAHGLAGTPTGVWASFNSTAYGGWTWTANSTHITITVANSGSYTVYWRAEYQP